MDLRKDVEEELIKIIKDVTLYTTSNNKDELMESGKLCRSDIKDIINAILSYKKSKDIISNLRYTHEYNIKCLRDYLMVLNIVLRSDNLSEVIDYIAELIDNAGFYNYNNITYYYRLVEIFTKTSSLIIKGGNVYRTRLLEMILNTLD